MNQIDWPYYVALVGGPIGYVLLGGLLATMYHCWRAGRQRQHDRAVDLAEFQRDHRREVWESEAVTSAMKAARGDDE